MLVPKKMQAHRQSLSAKRCFLWCFFAIFYRECPYINECKTGNFFSLSRQLLEWEMWQDLWTAKEKQINAKCQESRTRMFFKILVNVRVVSCFRGVDVLKTQKGHFGLNTSQHMKQHDENQTNNETMKTHDENHVKDTDTL